MQQHRLAGILFAASLLLVYVHATALEAQWYVIYPGFDVLIHLFGGALIALFALFVYRAVYPKTKDTMLSFGAIVLLIMATIGVGIIWEVLEQQLQLTYDAGYSIATAKDLAVDFAGALLAVTGIRWWHRKAHDNSRQSYD